MIELNVKITCDLNTPAQAAKIARTAISDALGVKQKGVIVEVKENVGEVKSEDGFDTFLQDATLAMREMWEDRQGDKIGEIEAQSLNDLLTNRFTDKRRGN